jgi:ABC-2 type transport system permease protein
VAFNPHLLSPWTGFAVFAAEVATVLLVAWLAFRRRDS